MKNNKAFLRSAVILTVITVMVILFIPEWNVGSVLVIVLLSILTGFQWFLLLWLRKH